LSNLILITKTEALKNRKNLQFLEKMETLTESTKTALRKEAEEQIKKLGAKPICVVVSGAHMFGFPSEDSDWDLRGIFTYPAEKFLGFREPRTSVNSMITKDGLEIDLVLKEMKPFLEGITQSNGNYIEKLLSPLILQTSQEHEEIKELTKKSISKKLYDFYDNFAQQIRAEGKRTGNLKNFLYASRLYMAGAHILNTGEIVQSLVDLNRDKPIQLINEMIEAKKSGELQKFQGDRTYLYNVLDNLKEGLDRAFENSHLPTTPSNKSIKDLESYLINHRRRV